MVNKKRFLSVPELAKLLGLSRIAVYKRIKKGQIKAARVGRNFLIEKKDLIGILDEKITPKKELEIDRAVKKAVKEYGETFRLLGSA
jgi:excisionase family DNA binding protein